MLFKNEFLFDAGSKNINRSKIFSPSDKMCDQQK